MSRLRLPALRATPLRPVFGSAAETRSAKIWAKRSAKASNGCEECLAIWASLRERAMLRNLRMPISPPVLCQNSVPRLDEEPDRALGAGEGVRLPDASSAASSVRREPNGLDRRWRVRSAVAAGARRGRHFRFVER